MKCWKTGASVTSFVWALAGSSPAPKTDASRATAETTATRFMRCLKLAHAGERLLEGVVSEACVDRVSVLVLGQRAVDEPNGLTPNMVGLDALHDVAEAVIDQGQRE